METRIAKLCFVGGLVIGIAIGAIVTTLLTPTQAEREARETQERIRANQERLTAIRIMQSALDAYQQTLTNHAPQAKEVRGR
jgi:uncharacterized membrane-anchored protein YhcB (DUF1043 family)